MIEEMLQWREEKARMRRASLAAIANLFCTKVENKPCLCAKRG